MRRWRAAPRHFGKLDRLLEGRTFLLGETLSLADITAGTSLYRYFELEIERPSLPQVERWYRTLQQREAFRDPHHDPVRRIARAAGLLAAYDSTRALSPRRLDAKPS